MARQVVAVTNLQDGDPLTVRATVNSLVPQEYDFVELSYTGDNITRAVFKVGGERGRVVATLLMTYQSDRLTTVRRT